jgi:GNAT superfamily N-acetyltransferase
MEIRVAAVEDALAVETVRLQSWQAAYRGLVADRYLDAMAVDVRRRADLIASGLATTLIAEDPHPVGMAVFGPARDADCAGSDELFALYVDPSRWRAGIGGALIACCAGVSVVWVLEGNGRARAFYERHGFRPDGTRKVLDLGGPVTELRMLLG